MSEPTNVTEKTRELVNRWIRARNSLVQAKQKLNSAECEVLNASNELGKWLVPSDQKQGEPFNIWFGSGIIGARQFAQNEYEVQWRKEPDGKDRHEYGV